jgi:hypothetical protein
MAVAMAMVVSGCSGSSASSSGGSSAGPSSSAPAVSHQASGPTAPAAFPASVPTARAGAAFKAELTVHSPNDSTCSYFEGMYLGRPILRYMGAEYQCGSATQSELDVAKVAASPVPGTGAGVLGESHDEIQLVELSTGCVYSAELLPDMRARHYVPGAITTLTAAMMYVRGHA